MADDALVLATIALASATVVLVFVTSVYAYFTHKLVREAQKDRQTRWVEHQLRDLYYPLLNSMETDHTLHRRVLELKDLLYLADDELEKALRGFVGLDVALTVGDLLIEGKGKDDRVAKERFPIIKEMVEDRILKLRSKLDKLNA